MNPASSPTTVSPPAAGTQRPTSLSRAALRAIRPHQWAKNSLVFAPVALAHEPGLAAWLDGLLGFAAFCAGASAGYLWNDLRDREADRLHPTKCRRPIASGALPARLAGALAIALGLGALALGAVALGAGFASLLALYLLLTSAYSLDLKRRAVLDVLVLAALYALRVLAGGAAADVAISPWLAAFSMFFFLSLALAKRAAELMSARDRGAQALARRGYRVEDLAAVQGMGVAAGFVAVLVIGLYVSSDDVRRLYASPWLLWGVCPVLLYWVSRIWLLAGRGELDEDPVLFATTDPPSYVCLAVIAALGALAGAGVGL